MLPAVPLRLPFTTPLDPSNLYGHLIATAIPGVEAWDGTWYSASVLLEGGPAVLRVAVPVDGRVPASAHLTAAGDLDEAVLRIRFAFDLDADPAAVDGVLGRDPALAPVVASSPGRRVPRTLDPDAFPVRAVLGQQVSTAAARTHGARLVAALGSRLETPVAGVTHLFPTAAQVLADAVALEDATRMPSSRRRTLVAVAAASLVPRGDPGVLRARLAALRGVGPWTVETIAMRAAGDRDAFPAADLGVLAAADLAGIDRRTLTTRAMRWAPYRAYAVQHLWAMGTHAVNRIPSGPARMDSAMDTARQDSDREDTA